MLRTRQPTELVPRMPDRPLAFSEYQLPLEPAFAVSSPREAQPGQTRLGIRIEGELGAPVSSIDLQGQIGKPTVALVGELYGVTVIVHHSVAVAGKGGEQPTRDYLVIYGNLAKPGPHIVNGEQLGPMAVVGYLGGEDDDDGGSLYLEVRLQRAKLGRPTEHLSQLVSSGVSVAVDPRNVLPLKR